MRGVFLSILDIILLPVAFVAAYSLKLIRRAGVDAMPWCKRVLFWVGVFPIVDHYYEPLFNPVQLDIKSLSEPRALAGINWNDEGQREFLSELASFASEFAGASESLTVGGYRFVGNSNFGAGDAEYWYCIIRHLKPCRIIEIGSGFSTMLAMRAIQSNRAAEGSHDCVHTCIEPYEMPWLESTGVAVIRQRLQDIGIELFSALQANDILFIDSSHIIRPQGDVLKEVLEILPLLNPGVVVHIHDIFSPRDYPRTWLVDQVRLWNEQYLLEAFLSHNQAWQILGALNYLRHAHSDLMTDALGCSFCEDTEPGSFYVQRISASNYISTTRPAGSRTHIGSTAQVGHPNAMNMSKETTV
jgi:hypothetical protein